VSLKFRVIFGTRKGKTRQKSLTSFHWELNFAFCEYSKGLAILMFLTPLAEVTP